VIGVVTGASAKSVLLTVLGEFVLPAGGEAWTVSLVDRLGELGIEEKNARQALARLGAQQVVEPERHGRRTRWSLTDEGRQLLESGAERIYRFGAPHPWDGRWLVLSVEVPDRPRQLRVRVRRQLEFAGFGFVRHDLAVAPGVERADAARTVLADHGVADALTFVATPVGELAMDELVGRAWQLDELATSYRRFVAAFARVRPTRGVEAFVALTRLVHAWRRFPFLDPELPAQLLPADWPGFVAKRTFDDQRSRWRDPARRHFDAHA
jgi:phenylacetic acid degradation operon negative regulatory protein